MAEQKGPRQDTSMTNQRAQIEAELGRISVEANPNVVHL